MASLASSHSALQSARDLALRSARDLAASGAPARRVPSESEAQARDETQGPLSTLAAGRAAACVRAKQ